MKILPGRRWLLCALLCVAGCESLLDPDDDGERGACPQTGEFGNYGCARLVLMVQAPPQPWPERYLWHVVAVPAREGTGADLSLTPRPDSGVVQLHLTRWHSPAPGSEDSASVWVHARLLEDPRPVAVGVPLPVFAADSVLHVARFAPVGEVPPVDTVWLTLRRR
jgi:hypothetical protein